MADQAPFGEFLRARRQRLRPEDVGLPRGARRRVEGLRREEVAALAGISADYSVRLEQGRDHTPSTQVVNALAGALRLHHEKLPVPGSGGLMLVLHHPEPGSAAEEAFRILAPPVARRADRAGQPQRRDL